MSDRRALALLLLLILAPAVGCGARLGAGRLAAGTPATVRAEGGGPAPAFFSGRTESIAEGTAVEVLSDSEGAETDPRRKVVVSIRGGPSRGLAGQMYRSDLRSSR